MAKTKVRKEYEDKIREDSAVGKTLGGNLRRLRKSSKTSSGWTISFAWLANLTALNRTSIWRFERGQSGMTVATLVRLREAFGCSWDDLLKGCESNIVKERKRFTGELKR